jgi:hypothetical protein
MEALLDIDQIAETVGLPADAARVLLELRRQHPAGDYRGRPLWVREAIDVLLVGDGVPA